jgi:hypothetical protein
LRQEYALPDIKFDTTTIHLLKDEHERQLEDIRTPADNEAAANTITNLVRDLTCDPASILHVSIAGGRKTMGFYLGYALSLFGRPQDRLSHVLVSAAFEFHPDFFFPTRNSRVIYANDNKKSPLDTSQAEITLADIPFVRLRHGLPDAFLQGRTSFSHAVKQLQNAIDPASLRFENQNCTIHCGAIAIRLPPAEYAYYRMVAARAQRNRPGVRWNDTGIEADFLRCYEDLPGAIPIRTRKAITDELPSGFYEQRRSRVNRILRDKLGEIRCQPYLIVSRGTRGDTRSVIILAPDRIQLDHG